MSLTPAEAAELARLEAEEEEYQRRLRGQAAVQSVERPRVAQQPPRRRFSLYRATVGSLRDAAQGLIDTSRDIRGFIGDNVGQPAAALFGGAVGAYEGLTGAPVILPQPEGSEQAGGAERVVRGIGSFLVPFTAATKVIGGLRGASLLGTLGRGAAAGAIADFTQVDPVSGNMANVLRDTFGISNGVLDSLASEEDDNALLNRFKAAATNAPVGVAADAFFEAGFRTLRAYREWRGTREEAEEIVSAARESGAADPAARDLADEPAAPVIARGNEAADTPAPAGLRRCPDAPPRGHLRAR
jgi:hypothetical protein